MMFTNTPAPNDEAIRESAALLVKSFLAVQNGRFYQHHFTD